MAVRIKIPTPLRKLTGQESEIEVEGETVGEVLEHLNEKYPTLKTHLYDAEGRLRRFVNLYLNEEDVRFLKGMDTPVEGGDEISIIPAIAGGAGPMERGR